MYIYIYIKKENNYPVYKCKKLFMKTIEHKI